MEMLGVMLRKIERWLCPKRQGRNVKPYYKKNLKVLTQAAESITMLHCEHECIQISNNQSPQNDSWTADQHSLAYSSSLLQTYQLLHNYETGKWNKSKTFTYWIRYIIRCGIHTLLLTPVEEDEAAAANTPLFQMSCRVYLCLPVN